MIHQVNNSLLVGLDGTLEMSQFDAAAYHFEEFVVLLADVLTLGECLVDLLL